MRIGQYALKRRALPVSVALAIATLTSAQDPPALNPFGASNPVRDDALPGYVEMSDGAIYVGQIHTTRDARLRLFDEASGRRREIPLRSIQRIDCSVAKEWMEKEWRFREGANAEKVYTGRAYPVQQYRHQITLQDGRSISGDLSCPMYIRDYFTDRTKQVILHKRHKGPMDTKASTVIYVRAVTLGEKAQEEGKLKAFRAQKARQEKEPLQKPSPSSRSK